MEREEPRRRRAGVVLAALLTFLGLGTVALYTIPAVQLASPLTAAAVPLIPLGIVAWLVAAILYLWAGRGWVKLMGLMAVGGFVLQVAWTAPYWPAPSPAPAAEPVTVISINLRCDGVGLEELAGVVDRVRPDVLVIQGADPETREYFAGEGWPGGRPTSTFRPLQVDPQCGNVIISDQVVSDVTAPEDERTVVRVDLPSGPLLVIPVDAPTPFDGLRVWDSALAQFERTANNHADVPTLLIGDFNAVREHLPIRRIVANGMVDAAEQAGSGWRPTFPANRGYPPFIALDHALINRQLHALDVQTFQAGINAHLGLIVRLDLG